MVFCQRHDGTRGSRFLGCPYSWRSDPDQLQHLGSASRRCLCCFRTRSDETAAEIELLRPHDDCCLRFHHPVPGESFLKRSRHHGIPDNRSVRRSADRCCTGWLGYSDLETRGRQRPGSRHRCRAVPRIPEQRSHLPRGRRCSRRDTGGESVYRRYAECAVCRGRNYGYHRSFDDAGWICH